MTTQGPLAAGTGADDSSVGTIAWSSPGNITSSNDTYASVTITASAISHYLKATNFGFTIPAGSTINGISVSIERKKSGTGTIKDSQLRIVKGGSIGATDRADTATAWPTSDTVATYGSGSDLWGETWTSTDINASTFGVALSATETDPTNPAAASVDFISITVTYTVTQDMGTATFQGVATMSGGAITQNPQRLGTATLQGVATMSATALTLSDIPTQPDYTKFDCYINQIGLQHYTGEGSRNATSTLPLDLTRQDVGNNPNEMPSALGRQFAQGDWSHGSGQGYFDKQTSDQAKFLYSEGFDISDIGLLKHLHQTLLNSMGALTAGSSGRSCQAGGNFFVADGTNVKVFNPITGAATTENPNLAEGNVTVEDLTTEGDQVYAALGVNGIHVRSAAGVWSHYSDAQAIRVAYVKDRLCAATARNFYEITASGAAPSPKLTLKTGWTFTDIGENGQYVYAPAILVSGSSGLSRIYHFGLDSSLNFVVQGSTPLPDNELCYSFRGYLGEVFLGCGRMNSSGGKDALLYKAVPSDTGFLPIELVMDSKGAGSRDLATRGMATYGRKILLGWTLGSSSPYGVREGLAIYDPALNSFSHHLSSSTSTSTPDPVLSVQVYGGRIVFVTIDGVYYEDITKYVSTATFISSISNFNNAGLKNWDQSDITTRALPSTSQVSMDYTTVHPDAATWSNAGIHSSGTKSTFSHPNVESATLAVRLVSSAATGQASAPEIQAFSVRTNPTAEPSYRLERTLHFTSRKAKSHRGQPYFENPRTARDTLRSLYLNSFAYHEADASYAVRLVEMQEVKRAKYKSTQGNPEDEEYIVQIALEGQET